MGCSTIERHGGMAYPFKESCYRLYLGGGGHLSTGWLLATFWASLETNVIVLLGVLSLIYWVGDVKTGWMRKYHDYIQWIISFAFLNYLYLMLKIDGKFHPQIWGQHWTFYNVLIVATFIFCMLMISRAYFAIIAVLTIAFFLTFPAALSLRRVLAFVVLIAIQYLLATKGRQIWSHRAYAYGLMILYAGVGMYGLLNLDHLPTDQGFWLRQIGAVVIQGVVGYEYLRLLIRRRVASDTFRREANNDRMTGVKNFGTFNQDIEETYRRFKNGGRRYVLIEMDVDHFKGINDSYGHLVGNQVLTGVARAAEKFAADLPLECEVYRMGGEEFCILIHNLDNYSEARSRSITRDLKAELDALRFRDGKGHEFGITVSIGEERVLEEDNNYLDIYNRVDHFLYAAKNGGRDQINLHGITIKD